MTSGCQTIEISVDEFGPSIELDGPPLPPPRERDDLSGQVLSRRYKLLRQLGQGGMGAVYLAKHLALDKYVAVKLLNTRYGAQQQAILRFVREAKATSRLRHENIVDVCDFGVCTGRVYLVMEHLEGEDLSVTLRRDGPMPWRRVSRILMQVCAALQAAHARRIVHRDIKPGNCFRVSCSEREDLIKVLDFGVAKVLGGDLCDGAAIETEAHIVVGTPEYMAPESFSGGEIDARVDIYAVGMLGYHLITGKLPFSRTDSDFLREVCSGSLRPPSQTAPGLKIPRIADSILMCALRARPAERFQTISQFGAALAASVDQTLPRAEARVSSGVATLVEASLHHTTVAPASASPPLVPTHPWPTILISSSVAALIAASLAWTIKVVDGSTTPAPSTPRPALAPPRPAKDREPAGADQVWRAPPQSDMAREVQAGPVDGVLGLPTGPAAPADGAGAVKTIVKAPATSSGARRRGAPPSPAAQAYTRPLDAPEAVVTVPMWGPESSAAWRSDMLRPVVDTSVERNSDE